MTDLTRATEEDVHFVILMALKLDDSGRHRKLNAKMSSSEIDGLAQRITAHLRRSNMWPHKGPPLPPHQAPDYSVAWRRADDESIDLRQCCVGEFATIRRTDMATIRIADSDQRAAENIFHELFSAENPPGPFGESFPTLATSKPENGYIDYHQMPGEWADRLIERGINARIILPPSAPV